MTVCCQRLLLLFILTIAIKMASGDLLKHPDVQTMAAGNLKFSLDLVRRCGAGTMKGKNVFLGPFSITTALAMTSMGAKGQTAEEMNKVLRWSKSQVPTQGFAAYLPLLQEAASDAGKGYVLVGAQRIYVNNKLALTPDFGAATQQHFASQAQAADFLARAEEERGNINGWVSEQTRGKISDLLPAGSVNGLTAMVLVQALYFKGNWLHKFDAKFTTPGDFFPPGGAAPITVDMMQQTRKFDHGEFPDLGCSALELPYASNSDNSTASHDLSMLILLPDERDGLDKLEETLTSDHLDNIRKNLFSRKVELKLPKFSVESSFALKEVLSALGMPLAFDANQADFSGMVTGANNKDLYISEVFHKAVVEVNEEGTEAAAATAVVMMKRSIQRVFPFVADHPFLFLIVDKRAHVVLFSGHVTLPPASPGKAKEEL